MHRSTGSSRRLWLELLACIALLASCARGALSDAHDSYRNVFGFLQPEVGPSKGGFLGRAFLVQNQPAQWVQVYSRALDTQDKNAPQPVLTTTNEKGGFFLGNLEPGRYEIYLVAPAGQGVKLNVAIAKGQLLEDDQVQLQPLVRIAGRVALEGRPVASGVLVYIPGTPFNCLSDRDGSYHLDVPSGPYRIRAEKEGFQPYDGQELALTADQQVDIHMDEDPWPNGKVVAATEDGYLIRGLTTTLTITPVYGVRYMRIQVYSSTFRQAADLGTWVRIKNHVTIEHTQEGTTQLQVEFMDQYGKISEPTSLVYYNTALDRSWTIYYGVVQRPVSIAAGEKAAFLAATPTYPRSARASDAGWSNGVSRGVAHAGGAPSGSDATAASPSTGTSPAQPAVSSPVVIPTNSGDAVVFLQPVHIAGGALLQGAARFNAPVTISGSADHPVRWIGDAASFGTTFAAATAIRYTQFQNMALWSTAATDPVSFDHSSFTNTTYTQRNLLLQGPVANSSVFTHSRFVGGSIEQYCAMWGVAGTAEPAGLTEAAVVALTIESSVLTGTGLRLVCNQTAPMPVQARLRMRHNNILGTTSGGSYFWTDNGTALPPPSALQTYEVTDNFVQFPGLLYDPHGGSTWPSFFGANAKSALPEDGI